MIYRRFLVKLCLAAPVLGASVLAATYVASAPPAFASASHCNESPFEVVRECTSVTGSGLHIDSLSGWANNLTIPINNFHIELYGPRGHIKNCPVQTLVFTSTTCTWSPHANEPKGDYCSRAWAKNIDGTYKQVGVECIGVHK
jgi:hypothetical protein